MQYSLGENRITLKQDKLFGKMFVVRHISDDEVEVKSLANLKSAIKRVRTNETKRELNQTPRTQARTSVKHVEQLVAENKVDEAKKAYLETVQKIDKAIQKGVLHRNAGNRQKTRLAQKIKDLGA